MCAKKQMTATELMAHLQNNNKYQEMKNKKEKQFSDFEEELNKDEKPIIQALKNVGLDVNSIWDLVNTTKPYPEAIPVLIKHLTKPYHLRTKAGIARSLAVKDAKNTAWSILLSEYDKATSDEKINDPQKKDYKDGLAVAISFLADKENIDTILDLIQDKKRGSCRVFFVDNLFKWRTESKVMEVVEKLKNDKDISTMIKEKFKIK
ncbi:MAG: hypothetical protein KAT05_07335 [Spirochaetes bacterium]|nr:hypothetical protein [Spirochaetota bacterium]